MEFIDEIEKYNGRFKGCWQPRPYQKLGSGGRRVRSKKKIGGERRQRIWRIKVSPKLKILQKVWPRRIFARIYEAYVRTMFRFARKLWLINDGDEFAGIEDSQPIISSSSPVTKLTVGAEAPLRHRR